MYRYFLGLLYATLPVCLRASTEAHHEMGLNAITTIKCILGIIAIGGGIGFFITTSARRAHWHPFMRRFFMGLFIGSNIMLQALFNVINIPSNKKAVCFIGRCWLLGNKAETSRT